MTPRSPATATRPGRLLGRSLRTRPRRRALVAAGMAASALLVLVLLGAREGATRAIVGYAGQPGCDLWIAPRGTDNLIRSGSLLPSALQEVVRADPAVAAVEPLLRTFVILEHGGRRVTVLAIGYRTASGLGGPQRLIAGRAPTGPDEIVLDRAAAHRLAARAGSTLLLHREQVRVSGISRDTNLIGTQLAFGDHGEAEDLMGVWGRASFLTVKLVDGADPGATAARLASRLQDAAVFTRDEFVAHNVREISAGLGPLLALVVTLGVSVSTALVALLAHAMVDDRRPELALLLALGAPIATLGRAVIARTTGIAAAGALTACALAVALSFLLERALPTVELSLRPIDGLATLTLCCGSAALASISPVARLRRVDPLEAFRP